MPRGEQRRRTVDRVMAAAVDLKGHEKQEATRRCACSLHNSFDNSLFLFCSICAIKSIDGAAAGRALTTEGAANALR
jgi:hypothetical protein